MSRHRLHRHRRQRAAQSLVISLPRIEPRLLRGMRQQPCLDAGGARRIEFAIDKGLEGGVVDHVLFVI